MLAFSTSALTGNQINQSPLQTSQKPKEMFPLVLTPTSLPQPLYSLSHWFQPAPPLVSSLPVLIVNVFIVFPINDILFHFNYYFNKPGNSSEKLLVFLSSDAAFGLQGC